MKVAYLTLFRLADNGGRYARMNDCFDKLDAEEAPFDSRVFPLITDTRQLVLSSLGLDLDDVWGSRWHNVEAIAASKRVLSDVLAYDPDVLHLATSRRVESILGRIAAHKLGVPVVAGPNIGGWYPIRPDQFWSGGLTERLSNRTDQLSNSFALHLNDPERVLAFSEYHRQMVRSVWDRADRIEVLHPAVHDRFCPEQGVERTVDLLFVGDLSEQKGYFTFLDALDRLDGRRSLTVDVIGGTPDHVPTFDTIDVRFHGFVPRDDLPSYYNRATLFVCLSSDEMGPNTLVEALSCGTPAVVNDEPGVNEYLHGGNGVRCDRNDLDGVVETIDSALRNQNELLARAAESAPTYDMSRTIQQLDSIYETVAN